MQQKLTSKTPKLPKPPSKTFQIIFFQLTGTLIFAYGVCAMKALYVANSLFVSMSLFLAICWGGQFSGGHFNGAVSLGMGLKRNGITISMVFVYYVSQTVGAFLGTFMAHNLINESNAPLVYGVTGFQAFQYFCGEVLGTFIFVFFIILATTEDTKFINNNLFTYLFIVAILYVARNFAYNTGGLNPSLALGMGFAYASINQDWNVMSQSWVVILGPFVGGACAALFYEKLYRPVFIHWKKNQ